jgi:hypothetical protein
MGTTVDSHPSLFRRSFLSYNTYYRYVLVSTCIRLGDEGMRHPDPSGSGRQSSWNPKILHNTTYRFGRNRFDAHFPGGGRLEASSKSSSYVSGRRCDQNPDRVQVGGHLKQYRDVAYTSTRWIGIQAANLVGPCINGHEMKIAVHVWPRPASHLLLQKSRRAICFTRQDGICVGSPDCPAGDPAWTDHCNGRYVLIAV